MRIGFFGGTFDPFHLGHAKLILAALNKEFFDKIYLVPSAIPPKKNTIDVSMPSYRMAMVEAWIKAKGLQDKLVLSDLEINRRDKSYTIDTIREIKLLEGEESSIYLICGADILEEIHTWHQADQLLGEISLYVSLRPGYSKENRDKYHRQIEGRYKTEILYFDAPQMDISSSQIRELLSVEGRDADLSSLVPSSVINFIRTNALYDNSFDLTEDLSLDQYKQLLDYEYHLRPNLKTKRLIHSLNTMRVAFRLAKINGFDVFKAALTGLVHDSTKNMRDYKFYPDLPIEIHHAYSGSEYAKDIFNIVDEDMLNAIKYHTTSRKGASLLEKIVFVADKIEPSRGYPRAEELREISYNNLDKGYHECLADIIKVLKSKGKEVNKDTLEAYEASK